MYFRFHDVMKLCNYPIFGIEIREEEKKEEIQNLFRSHKQLTTQIGDKEPSSKEDKSRRVLEAVLNQWSVSEPNLYKSLKSKKGGNRKTKKNSKQKTTI